MHSKKCWEVSLQQCTLKRFAALSPHNKLSQNIGTENCWISYLHQIHSSLLLSSESSPVKFQQELSLVHLHQPDFTRSVWKCTKIHQFSTFKRIPLTLWVLRRFWGYEHSDSNSASIKTLKKKNLAIFWVLHLSSMPEDLEILFFFLIYREICS